MASDTGPWTPAETSPSGQVFEFRLWALFTGQSRGSLHVFLPLSDRGIDALVHRLADGTYIPIQAKGRTSLTDDEVHIVVWADSLADDNALIVSGLATEDGLGPTTLVVSEGDFKRLAAHSTNNGRPIYSTSFGMHPRSVTHWLPYLVLTQRVVERFGVIPSEPAALEALPQPSVWRSDVGFLGESQVVRSLAEEFELNLFRPFPDLETSELAVVHLQTRKVLGIQVKTVGIDSVRRAGTVRILASSFRPSPTTYFVVLAWLREERQFHSHCLWIPSEQIRALCEPSERDGHFSLDWHPGSKSPSKLDPYRRELSGLSTDVLTKLSERP